MADISDVEQAVTDLVTSSLYPEGGSQPSIVGVLCRIYRGWPNAATLNADLSDGAVNVTIASDNDSGRTTTRYLPRWQHTRTDPGANISAVDHTITIAGSPAAGDVVGVIIDGVPCAVRVQTGDSPELVASNLAQLIQSKKMASVQGARITVPGAASITARVVCDSPATFESRRQEKDLRITCWCPAPSVRDAVAAAIDAGINQIVFLPLPDPAQARIIYRNTANYDQAQNAMLYRRDLIYTVEYPTLITNQQPSMLFGASDLNCNITYG
jgi:hypothetical protein